MPHFDTQFIMTDDCNTFYTAFVTVFPFSKAHKVLCVFHISQSIGRKVKEFIPVSISIPSLQENSVRRPEARI